MECVSVKWSHTGVCVCVCDRMWWIGSVIQADSDSVNRLAFGLDCIIVLADWLMNCSVWCPSRPALAQTAAELSAAAWERPQALHHKPHHFLIQPDKTEREQRVAAFGISFACLFNLFFKRFSQMATAVTHSQKRYFVNEQAWFLYILGQENQC